ncbi:protein translocase subunit secF [Rhodospirillum rubrum F11]|uniref:Protein-export membrane protein SecF n=3 Tax=Rhodospirillum rubrum TaxID=1085 RepID=Q2RTI2_RHORT|nr:protein translocase subunit SecF [Rhodospirillum rubrum]ABC22563.1 protein translocase subunit secF [Rhodospirillum rubrum ATCC 11170]AEO48281.1 protein translocase subunit secF [Rhodospirillum rubrum F11]MBK5954152.1 protein translocase subunit SecF [Rhodospirillum rubrum]QXG82190.1 protein translocase subunit SecF [Rhodospirillum rubrum]
MPRPFARLTADFHYDFLVSRARVMAASAALLLVCLLALGLRGLDLGIDFTGGLVVEARTATAMDPVDLRQSLRASVVGEVDVTTYGEDGRSVTVRVGRQTGGDQAMLQALEGVKTALGEGATYRRTNLVGPTVGGEATIAGLLTVALALVLIAAYVWLRFDWHYALGVVLALSHDVVAVLGLYALFQIPFDLTSIAALLTVACYSINDTVVIFDRVREELALTPDAPLATVVNKSINRTLARTIVLSGSTLVTMACLALLGGPQLRGFALALIWGTVVGTLSSIYVAVPALMAFRGRSKTADDGREGEDDGEDTPPPRAAPGKAKNAPAVAAGKPAQAKPAAAPPSRKERR